MEYSRTVAGQLQLDDYVEIAHRIYSENDKYRSIWDIWAHTLHHAAGIAEAIRKSEPAPDLFDEIADCSLWLLTAIYRMSKKIAEPDGHDNEPPETLIRIKSSCSNLLWQRYPAVCHLCYLRRTEGDRKKENASTFLVCDCLVHPSDAPYSKETKRRALAALRKFGQEMLSNKPKTIDEWQEMFGRVFASNIDRLSLTDFALHFLEELGEVSDAMIRIYSYKEGGFTAEEATERQFRLEAQLADSFSRLFAIVGKINRVAEKGSESYRELFKQLSTCTEPIRLSAILWRRYGRDDWNSFWCRFCGQMPCKCNLIFVPANRPIKEFLQLLEH
jgi:NTP pyrophosphatase (non-canonical NTP hydrolase)